MPNYVGKYAYVRSLRDGVILKDFKNNAMGLAESVGYYRGVMDSIKVKK